VKATRNAVMILGGLLTALIVACGSTPTAVQTSPVASAAQASPTPSSSPSSGTQASCSGAKGCAHYEITGGINATGDLPLMTANGFKPGSALLDYQGHAVFNGVNLATRIHLSVGPPVDQFTLNTDAFGTAAGPQQKCTWNLGSLTSAGGSGNVQCDTIGIFPTGSQVAIKVKITFDYHS
jgi:hypothetical protein